MTHSTYRGAPLGQPDVAGTPSGPFRLFRAYINGGGYDINGVYWGLGQPLYRYGSGSASGFLRAASRQDAKDAIRCAYPSATFYR